jgi:hypothetical protein
MNVIAAMKWRVMPGLPQYEVSECGDVRRISTGTRLKGHINADGYPEYAIRTANGRKLHMTAHRMVAYAFIGPPPSPNHEVAHNDGSRLNCHFNNLRWATPTENQGDRKAHGNGPVGEGNGRAKITDADVVRIRREYRAIKRPGSGRLVAELDEKYGLCRSAILDIAMGRTWSHIPMENT